MGATKNRKVLPLCPGVCIKDQECCGMYVSQNVSSVLKNHKMRPENKHTQMCPRRSTAES